MNKRLRFVVVLSLLFFIGALQYATPLFVKQDRPQGSSHSAFKIDVSYESVKSDGPRISVNDYGQVEQGSFFLQEQGQQGYLLSPLLDTRVDMNITGLVARARVTQVFTNTSDQWVNGIYVFPLPENAAVDHLEMHIGKRRIVGEIHPKQKAKAIYEQAKREGKKASLLEQQRPNLFKNSVANIGPGERIQVTIEYQQAVQYDNNVFSLRFPTTITERYLPKTISEKSNQAIDENGWGITQPVFIEDAPSPDDLEAPPMHKVAMQITLNAGVELDEIASELHPIHQAKVAPGRYEISLQQDMIANRDFVLSWQTKADKQPNAAHFIQQTENGHYGMVMLMPPSVDTQTLSLPREVVFVIDTSGSMSGVSIQQAKEALALSINKLPDTDAFNLVEFDSDARILWPQSKAATQQNKHQALAFINGLQADGGTEILSALQLALGNQTTDSEKLRQVIFITDGAVGNEASLFEYINHHLQDSRLFTVGIGSAPNSHFMSEAARMGKGTFTYIGSVDSVQTAMQDLFSKLTHPVLADLNVNFHQDVEMYPRNLPDLYKGEPLMISYKAQSPTSNLILSGSLKDQYWQKSLSLDNAGQQSGLDVLWARRKIAQLERDIIKGQDREQTSQQIQDVAMAHHLVSRMTSLVAVDKTPTALALSEDVRVKNHAPKGQMRGMLPQTATPASLQMLVALFFLGIALCATIFTKNRSVRA